MQTTAKPTCSYSIISIYEKAAESPQLSKYLMVKVQIILDTSIKYLETQVSTISAENIILREMTRSGPDENFLDLFP